VGGKKNKNKQKFKVWLRQGSKVETTKHTGIKTPFPKHQAFHPNASNRPSVVKVSTSWGWAGEGSDDRGIA
jgi:hypothetical protein